MIEDKTITLSVAELVKTYTYLYKQAELIRKASLNIAKRGKAEKTERAEVINTIATAMTQEIEDFVDQLSKAEGNAHIVIVEPDTQYH